MNSSASANQSESRRYLALHRCAIVAAALCVWNAGLWSLWNFEADRRLRAFIAERRALGEPVLAEDFDEARTPDGVETAALIRRANDVWYEHDILSRWNSADAPYPFCIGDGIEDRNAVAPIAQLLRTAADRPFAYFGGTLHTPVIANVAGDGLIVIFRLISILNAEAWADVRAGRVDLACESWAAALRVMKHGSAPPVSLLSALIEHGGRERVCTSIQCLDLAAPGGMIESESAVMRLRDELLDETRFANQLRQALICERLCVLDLACELRSPLVRAVLRDPEYAHEIPLSMSALPLFAPLFKLDGWRYARRISEWLDALPAESYPAILRSAGPHQNRNLPGFLRHGLLAFDADNDEWLKRTVQRLLHARARTRLIALYLAARLFEEQHGCLPVALQDLAPAYIQQLPDDPFAAPGTPFQYCRDAAPPRIFSVGPSGTFDGARARRLTADEAWKSYPDDPMVLLPPREPSDRSAR